MEDKKVKDIMVKAQGFPSVSAEATFLEALEALESAQEAFTSGKAKQRIVLVKDGHGAVVGKISPIDLSRGLEPGYKGLDERLKGFMRFGVGYLIKPLKEQYWLWAQPFEDLCRKAVNVKVKEFMSTPDENRVVGPDDSLAEALHLFVTANHDSLFVVEEGRIIGLLRFSDVYRMISGLMKSCERG